MTISTRYHTILLLVGPSNCGKSTLAKRVSRISPIKTVRISSDDLRRELLVEPDLHKHDDQMMYVSDQAFNLLFNRLKNYTSYPVNIPLVIVDTTGLSEPFRDKVIEVAKDNHYNIETILFDYKDSQDYYKYLGDQEKKFVISRHIKKFRQEALPRISLKKMNKIHKIRSIEEIQTVEIKVEDKEIYESHLLDPSFEYEVVGDVHNQYEKLKELILLDEELEIVDDKISSNNPNKKKRYILNGDWIDKGSYTFKNIVYFIELNLDWFILVKGNHENFVYKYLNDELEELPSREVIDNYFTTIGEFEEINEKIHFLYEEWKNRFLGLVEKSKEFYIHPNFIVTHAPCKKKYLGKLDPESLRNMRNYRIPRKEDFTDHSTFILELEKSLSFIQKEGLINNPSHIFGHVAFRHVLKYVNKFGIDTGAGENHKLTSIIINGYMQKPFIKNVFFDSYEQVDLPSIFRSKDKVDELDEDTLKIVKNFARKGVNYISGTMCPADKKEDELESLEEGLKYFKDNGVNEVILQPKYMGSRCQIYLFQDINKCYAVSRNGFRINHVNLESVYKQMIDKFYTDGFSFSVSDVELIILDGELMPWKALGKGLIDNQYKVIQESLQHENIFLDQVNFDGAYLDLIESEEYLNFKKDKNEIKLTKKELIDKYTHSKYETYSNLLSFEKEYVSKGIRDIDISIYLDQVTLYGSDQEIHYKPFNILKVVNKDGKEETNFDASIYTSISDDIYCILNDLQSKESYTIAKQFFENLTVENKMEGVVIKPVSKKEGVAPYIKVRNRKYLTLIYGYDYLTNSKYEKLLKQKNIKHKMRLSISESNLANKLLAIPYRDITTDNREYLGLVAKLVADIKKEETLDPRL